ATGDRWWLANTLIRSGLLGLGQGDVDAALRYGREAIDGQRLLHNTHGTNSAVELVAWVAAARGQYRRAARLLGAADRRWRDLGGSPFATGVWVLARGGYEAAARTALGEAGFLAEYDRRGPPSPDGTAAHAPARPAPPQRTRQPGGP